MTDEVSGVKNFFASRQVPLCDEWLESCIKWCKEEYLGSSYALKDLQIKIFEQWLLLDLRDVEIPSLPSNLCSHKKYILNGNYCLQIMQVVDISRPKHWQLQRIRGDATFTKNNWQESEAIGTGKRVLQLTLTDGVQQIEAMEYRPIRIIHINLSPGIKVRLVGPITIRRGMLMLEEHNIKILGGEVEEIAVSHAAENVLARKLNLPENPNPKTVTEQMDIENESSTQANESHQQKPFASNNIQNSGIRNVNNPVSNSFPREPIQMPNTRNTNLSHPKPLASKQVQMINTRNVIDSFPSSTNNQPKRNKSEVDYPQIEEFPDPEDELRISQEIDLLLEAESDVARPTKILKQNPRTNSPDLFNEDFDLNYSDVDAIEQMNDKIDSNQIKIHSKEGDFDNNFHNSPVLKNKDPNIHNQKNTHNKGVVDLSDSLDDNADDIFEHIDIDAHLNEAVELKNNSQNTAMNIEKLKRNMSSISKGVFRVKAKFKTVVEKLTMADNAYKMVIRIEDGSGELDVRLANEIVSDFAGYCAEALISLKCRILENDEAAKHTVLKAMSHVKEKLLQLDNVMEIQINREEGLPTVIKILQ